jgi:lipopolysaccharide/colanic/teichoic acid biosynthesis glycosyltransferase
VFLIEWDDLPNFMKNDAVLRYYRCIREKSGQLMIKRFFDIFFSLFFCLALSPIILLISIIIKIDSPGPIFFKQERVARYGRSFKIFKFRTMVQDAETKGPLITISGDKRVTRVGRIIRRFRLDEFPQIFNVLKGDMSFVGSRPEVPKYVAAYTDEMKATLLMAPGVTSFASIKFKDEETLISQIKNVDSVYLNEILPQKMEYNLLYLKNFGIWLDIKLSVQTVLSALNFTKD